MLEKREFKMSDTATTTKKRDESKTAAQVKVELKEEIKQIQAAIRMQSASTRAQLVGRFRAS
jgi:hypothetical protein